MVIETIVTGGQYDDPTEWNGDNPECKLCPKTAEMDDEYCEDHQRCYFCGENDDCDCEEEMKLVSACCGSRIDNDYKLCYECKDHAESAWDEYISNMNVKHAVQAVRDLPINKTGNDENR
jgi:hypothetical protein